MIVKKFLVFTTFLMVFSLSQANEMKGSACGENINVNISADIKENEGKLILKVQLENKSDSLFSMRSSDLPWYSIEDRVSAYPRKNPDSKLQHWTGFTSYYGMTEIDSGEVIERYIEINDSFPEVGDILKYDNVVFEWNYTPAIFIGTEKDFNALLPKIRDPEKIAEEMSRWPVIEFKKCEEIKGQIIVPKGTYIKPRPVSNCNQ